ncbi:MAG: hypothetical protein ABWJ63_03760 [Thermus sp.]|nr:hypothetical protein [Thermus sp. 2.9]
MERALVADLALAELHDQDYLELASAAQARGISTFSHVRREA